MMRAGRRAISAGAISEDLGPKRPRVVSFLNDFEKLSKVRSHEPVKGFND